MNFTNVIQEINKKVDSFNSYLRSEYHFKTINVSDPEIYSDKVNDCWGGEYWASKDAYGVYILFGIDDISDDLGIYIGKASQQYIGHRLWSHLKPHREMMDYHKKIGEQKFTFYALSTLVTSTEESRFLATSLEEHLISGGYNSAKLINKVGKK